MKRHSFDAVSFVFGALFIWMGVQALLGQIGWWDFTRRAWPVLIVAAGLAVIVGARRDNHP